MGSKEEDGEGNDDGPPIWALKHYSEEAVRVGSGEPNGPRHRRAQSELMIGHRRSNSFQRLRSHVQRAWKWGSGPGSREEGRGAAGFNPEILANQKRQWYQHRSKVMVILLVTENNGFKCFISFY